MAATPTSGVMASFPPVINLNVGGQIYTTSLSTLTQSSESMLGAMFSGRFAAQQDSNGNYFIDRDGALFRYVLAFLRNGALHFPKNFHEFDLLLKEAEFFQISALIQTIKEHMKHSQRQEADDSEVLTVFGRRHGKKSFLESVSGRLRSLTEMFHSTNTEADPLQITPYANQSDLNYNERTGKLTVKEFQKTPTTDFAITIAQAHGFRLITEPYVPFSDVDDVGNSHWILLRSR